LEPYYCCCDYWVFLNSRVCIKSASPWYISSKNIHNQLRSLSSVEMTITTSVVALASSVGSRKLVLFIFFLSAVWYSLVVVRLSASLTYQASRIVDGYYYNNSLILESSRADVPWNKIDSNELLDRNGIRQTTSTIGDVHHGITIEKVRSLSLNVSTMSTINLPSSSIRQNGINEGKFGEGQKYK
jgi:hypothetical protein